MDEKDDGSLEGLENPSQVIEPDSSQQPIAQVAEPEKRSPATQAIVKDSNELKFTGYTPPTEKGFGAYFSRNKLKVIGIGFAILVIGVVGTLMLVSGGADEAVQQVSNANQIEQTNESDEEPSTQAEAEEAAHISDAQFSVDKNGQFYGLETLDGTSWLDRSQHSWKNFIAWEGWLFFTADRVSSATENGAVGIEVFNYDDQEYRSIATVESMVLSEPMYIVNEHLYVRFEQVDDETDAYDGATYRCRLDVDTGCSKFEKYYDGYGEVHIMSNETLYIIAKEASQTTVSVYDTTTKKLTEVAKTEQEDGAGPRFERVDREGNVWYTDLVEGGSSGTVQLSRVYGVDANGDVAFVIPANAVPIPDAQPVAIDTLQPNQILYANNNSEVIFDTDTKQFEAPKQRDLADNAEKEETLLGAEIRLTVPKEYLMRVTN